MQPRAAGIALRSPAGKLLFLKRGSDCDHPATWCFPGGGIEYGEDARSAALRETAEETSYSAGGLIHPLDERDGFVTFQAGAPEEFTPQLNGEHTDYQWAFPHDAPQPLHPGVAATLADRADTYHGDLHRLERANARAGVSEDTMADRPDDLSAAQRRAIPSKEYGLPSKRAYPIENRGHAIAAKARADEEYKAGRLTKAEYDEIVSRANAYLSAHGEDSFNGLVSKLEHQGYSKEVATKIAGKVAAEKGDDCAMSEDSFDALCKDLEAKGFPKGTTDGVRSSDALDAALAHIVDAWNEAQHPRAHGKFAEKAVAASKRALKAENKTEPSDASAYTTAAHKATERAAKTGKEKDHRAAADLHSEALVAHHYAGMESDSTHEDHYDVGQHHATAAEHHLKAADLLATDKYARATGHRDSARYIRDFAGYYAPEKLGKTRRLTPEGFLLCEGVALARTGEQLYKVDELTKGLEDSPIRGDAAGFLRVHRMPEDVFHPDTMASFEGKPVTVDHPAEFVTPETHNKLSVGHVQNVRRGTGVEDDLLLGDILITSADAIAYVNKHLPELSAGYDADYEQGDADGEAFQRNIRANHVALVERGRAGPRVSIKDSIRSKFMSNQSLVQKIVNTLMLRGVKATDAAAAAEDIAKEATDATAEDALDRRIRDAVDRALKARDESEEARRREAEAGRRENQSPEHRAAERENGRKAGDGTEAEAAAGRRENQSEAHRRAEAEGARKDAEDAERAGDTILEAEGTGKVINLGKVYTGDSASRADGYSEMVARAEILSPGIAIPTKDALKGTMGKATAQFMRDALERTRTRDAAGADIVGAFLMGRRVHDLAGAELLAAFNGASNFAKLRNNSAPRSLGAVRTGDFSRPSTIADINRLNREFWQKQSA